ncbi:hypothetical protein CRUP_012001 [Coryphaenoides rupestris]|nr:hypothetical protein CRUP_012001 [Coryphaenoides rupestris]
MTKGLQDLPSFSSRSPWTRHEAPCSTSGRGAGTGGRGPRDRRPGTQGPEAGEQRVRRLFVTRPGIRGGRELTEELCWWTCLVKMHISTVKDSWSDVLQATRGPHKVHLSLILKKKPLRFFSLVVTLCSPASGPWVPGLRSLGPRPLGPRPPVPAPRPLLEHGASCLVQGLLKTVFPEM